MQLIKYYIVFFLVFGACKNQLSNSDTILSAKAISKNLFVDKKELKLNPANGEWLYKNVLFTGFGFKLYKNDSLLEKTTFYKGKREGEDFKYFENGTLKRQAFYVDNKLHGKKLNYDSNGILISESNYLFGKKHGVQKVWYSNGQLAKMRNLFEGKEKGLQKAWLQNGALYVNYEAKNGRVFGMKRANLCYQLKNEKIEERKKI